MAVIALELGILCLVFIGLPESSRPEETQLFAEVLKSPSFVDKTLFIEKFISLEKHLFIAAPTHFGKSTNMDMLATFFGVTIHENGTKVNQNPYLSPKYKLFSKLKGKPTKITQKDALIKKHFGQYPIIKIELQNISVDSYPKFLDSFNNITHALYQKHQYLMNSTKLDESERKDFILYSGIHNFHREDLLTNSLQKLSAWLRKHFDQKCIVLVDEFDGPISTIIKSKINRKQAKTIIDYIETSIGLLLKGNHENVWKSLMTGSTLWRGDTDNLNMIRFIYFSDLPDVARFYGFLEEEIRTLSGVNKRNFQNIKSWYNGYGVKNRDMKLYNSYSIAQYLKSRQLKPYWTESCSFSSFNVVINSRSLKNHLNLLLSNVSLEMINLKEVFEIDDIMTLQKIENAWSLCRWFHLRNEKTQALLITYIMELGYLTYDTETDKKAQKNNKNWDSKLIRLKIPNLEIRSKILGKA